MHTHILADRKRITMEFGLSVSSFIIFAPPVFFCNKDLLSYTNSCMERSRAETVITSLIILSSYHPITLAGDYLHEIHIAG
jgi:hypothetical protein